MTAPAVDEAPSTPTVVQDPPPAEPRPTHAPPVGPREVVFLVVAAVALAVVVIGTQWGVFTPDTRPDLYQDPGGFLTSSVQAWVGGASGLGQGNFNAGAAPVAAVVWVIRALGASPWLAVRIWRLLIMLVGAWGIRRYLGELLGPRLTVQARVLATVFWVVNPYAIVAGSTTPILLPYALLPWTLYAFVKATRDPRSWRWPAWFALGFFAQTGLNAGVVPFFQLLALPAHLVHARWVEGRSWRDLGRVVVRCGVMSLAVSLYWVLPSLIASGTGSGIAAGTEQPADVARTSSYAETSRLLGNWPLYGRAGDRLFLGGYAVYLTSIPVLLASFLVPLAAGVSLWLARARERLLVLALLLIGLPVMVGLYPPNDPSPAGGLLERIFETVPASLAFRTTNKVGAIVVLAETIALVIGWRAWQARIRDRGRVVRWSSGAAVVVLLVAVSTPFWNGSLYPLGYTIPASWERATDDLDQVRSDQRVLAVPGGIGGNYRWGMRSPDDLFPSLLDRPVAVRNTVVGRGDPAGNFMSAFDLALAQGALPPEGTSTTARYLGAGDVLVRNDALTEEVGGAPPWLLVRQIDADPGLTATETYGTRGVDTIPGASGPPTRKERREDPDDAALHPLMTYAVVDPSPLITAAPADRQVLVVGDGEATAEMVGAGIVDGSQPILQVADLGDEAFADAVADGGRIVLTDTNRRRAWDVNRVANSTSATLTVDEDIDAGNGATLTRWPDQPADQSVTEIVGSATVGADRDAFGLHPYGRPSNAFDGDPTTAWITGGFNTARGSSIWIEYEDEREIDSVRLVTYATEPSSVTAVRIEVGDKQVLQALKPGDTEVVVPIEPVVSNRIEVTIVGQSGGDNPVGISEIQVDDGAIRPIVRLPETLEDRADAASPATREALAALPLDVLLKRQRGSVVDPLDDEESQLDRRFSLPDDRTFTFSADLSAFDTDPEAIASVRAGEDECFEVAALDGEAVTARITSTRAEIATGSVHLEGCESLALEAGEHDLRTIFGWRLNSVHLASPGTAAERQPDAVAPADPSGGITVTDRTATRIEMTVDAGEGNRYLRTGEALDERWTLTVDGEDAGPPILVDGYSTGWKIDGDAHELTVAFGPQRAVEATFVASAASVVVVAAVALLPAVALPGRRRRRVADEPSEPDATGGDA